MKITKKKIYILVCIAIAAFILARILVRWGMNLLVGGSLFGGNIL